MKWQFELSDCPINVNYPVKAFSVMDNGVKRGPFHMKVEDLVAALSNEPETSHDADALRNEETIISPALPFGTIRYSTNENRTRERLTMEIPKNQWDIRYGDEVTPFYLGLPRLVVQYLVETSTGGKRKVIETRLYAVLDDKNAITNSTPLFPFPFPNVGKENGIVCWGQNTRFELNELTELTKLFLSFLSAPFNEDHGVRTTLGIPNFRRLIEQIQEQPFDDEWLIPSQKTFGSLFEN